MPAHHTPPAITKLIGFFFLITPSVILPEISRPMHGISIRKAISVFVTKLLNSRSLATYPSRAKMKYYGVGLTLSDKADDDFSNAFHYERGGAYSQRVSCCNPSDRSIFG